MANSAKIVEIAEHIAAKQRLYRTAYDADLKQLRAPHGDAVDEALRMLERPARRTARDDRGHAAQARRGISRFLRECYEESNDG
jgi:hypothetical protein